MGSWAATCAVSRLAIRPGDQVLWVYATPSYVNTTYDLSNIVWRYYDKIHEWEKMDAKNKEFAKKFPEWKSEILGQKEPLFSEEHFKPKQDEFQWGFGEYDDYGWVEDENLPDEYRGRHFLVRKDVADQMSEFGKTLISGQWYKEKDFLKESYLYCFLIVCTLTRIQLFGHELLGRQYPDSDEMKEQRKVRAIINKEFQKVVKEIRQEEKEYKEMFG